MKHKPTEEQETILKAFKLLRTGESLKINAVAGSGKSSTLRMLAEENLVPSLYVCFNKQNADEASKNFPKHTECRTMHSLAFSVFGRHLYNKISPPFDKEYVNRGRTLKEIVNLYNIQDVKDNKNVLTANKVASLVKKSVDIFQNSSDDKIDTSHITKAWRSSENSSDVFVVLGDKAKNYILELANKFWEDKVNPSSKVKADHDTYQKLFQLSKPYLPYDVLYVDEAQDSSPVVLDIIKQQTHCKVVYVGDSYQSIYAFRQAVNAMNLVKAPTHLLSKSFRYGQDVANMASYIIRGAIKIKGNENIESVVTSTPFDDNVKHTKIFRTNSALLEEAVSLIQRGVKVKCEIDTKKFQSMMWSVHYLFLGDKSKVKDEEISVFSNWRELLDESENSPELKRIVSIVSARKVYEYSKALDSLANDQKNSVIKGKGGNTNYNVLLTTAHKSKGVEYKNVQIAEDFPLQRIFDKDETDQQEINLFYVACTRATNVLSTSSLGSYLPIQTEETNDE